MTHILFDPHATRPTTEAAHESMARVRLAQREWARSSVRDRAARMRGLRRALVARMDDIIETVHAEVGKPRMEGLVHEVFITAAHLENLERDAGRILRPERARSWPLIHKRAERWLEPYGVIGIIGPANFPFFLTAMPTFAALMAGNGVVLKPSERAPRTARLLESIVREAIPELPDIFMLLQGGGEMGAALVEAVPDKLVFIGSLDTGRRVASAAAERVIPLLLELGANDAGIVCEDGDAERAAAAIVWAATANTGQICMSVQRALVHERVYDRFVEQARQEMERIRFPEDVGELQAGGQLAAISELVRDAISRGARLLKGGVPARELPPLYPPTLLVDVDEGSALHRRELFGPVLAVTRVASDEDAVRIANASPFGLNASVWSKDAERARRIAARLRTGAVVINDVLSYMGMNLPYGGVGASGFGRLLGREGLLEFVRTKAVVTARPLLRREPYWYPYTRQRYELLRRAFSAVYGVGLKNRVRGLRRRKAD